MFYGSYVGFGGHVGDAGYVPAGAVMFDGVADYLSWTPIKTASSNTDKTISFWLYIVECPMFKSIVLFNILTCYCLALL